MSTVQSAPMWVPAQQRELDAMTRPEQITLVNGERIAARNLLDVLGDVLRVAPTSVSEVGLTPTPAQSVNELHDRLGASALLYDCESVCWQPWLNVDPLRFLRTHARRRGVIALWPGSVSNGVASFSAPGRRDHVSFDATGIFVLRPTITRFPDQVPYTLERIS